MADQAHTDEPVPQVDFASHERDWTKMQGMLKYGAIISFIIAMVVIMIIAH